MQAQYSQGAATSHHPPYTTAEISGNGSSITSSLRQWRKKDYVEKQQSGDTSTSVAENTSHVARVAPHTYYPPRPANDVCHYQHQYSEYGDPYKSSTVAPVKYSEIVENQQAQSLDNINPVIPKLKEKEYVDFPPPQPHLKQYQDLPLKPPYADTIKQPYSDQYMVKEPQMPPYMQKQSQMHQYMQKEPYQQFLSKYNMPNQYPPQPYPSEPNNFLAHLNKINPRMAQSIMNDTHLRDAQIPMYHNMEQSRSYPQSQRMYHGPPMNSSPTHSHRNVPPQPYSYSQPYNCSMKQGNDPYNRMPYQHNPPKYLPDYKMNSPIEPSIPNISPQSLYNERLHNMNYGPMSPNYPHCNQLEYAQHYQHRRSSQIPPEYFSHSGFKPPYMENLHMVPDENCTTQRGRKPSLKQYLENWVDEELAGNLPDLIISNNMNDQNMENPIKSTVCVKNPDKQEQPLYVLDSTEIPDENLPHFLHLQQFEKLPDNIRGYYTSASSIPVNRRIIVENEAAMCAANPLVRSDPTLRTEIPTERISEGCAINQNKIIGSSELPSMLDNTGQNLENKVVQIHIIEEPDASNSSSSNPPDTVIVKSHMYQQNLLESAENCLIGQQGSSLGENIKENVKNMPVIDDAFNGDELSENSTGADGLSNSEDSSSNQSNSDEISDDVFVNQADLNSGITSIYKEMENMQKDSTNTLMNCSNNDIVLEPANCDQDKTEENIPEQTDNDLEHEIDKYLHSSTENVNFSENQTTLQETTDTLTFESLTFPNSDIDNINSHSEETALTENIESETTKNEEVQTPPAVTNANSNSEVQNVEKIADVEVVNKTEVQPVEELSKTLEEVSLPTVMNDSPVAVEQAEVENEKIIAEDDTLAHEDTSKDSLNESGAASEQSSDDSISMPDIDKYVEHSLESNQTGLFETTNGESVGFQESNAPIDCENYQFVNCRDQDSCDKSDEFEKPPDLTDSKFGTEIKKEFDPDDVPLDEEMILNLDLIEEYSATLGDPSELDLPQDVSTVTNVALEDSEIKKDVEQEVKEESSRSEPSEKSVKKFKEKRQIDKSLHRDKERSKIKRDKEKRQTEVDQKKRANFGEKSLTDDKRIKEKGSVKDEKKKHAKCDEKSVTNKKKYKEKSRIKDEEKKCDQKNIADKPHKEIKLISPELLLKYDTIARIVSEVTDTQSDSGKANSNKKDMDKMSKDLNVSDTDGTINKDVPESRFSANSPHLPTEPVDESLEEPLTMIKVEQTYLDESYENSNTNVVYQIADNNVVLQIADELLEINVTTQNGRKVIFVKTLTDAIILSNYDEAELDALDLEPEELRYEKICEDVEILLNNNYLTETRISNNNNSSDNILKDFCDDIDAHVVDGDDVCIFNEEIVSSSTAELLNEHKSDDNLDNKNPVKPKKAVTWEDEKKLSHELQSDRSEDLLEPPMKRPKTKAALKYVEDVPRQNEPSADKILDKPKKYKSSSKTSKPEKSEDVNKSCDQHKVKNKESSAKNSQNSEEVIKTIEKSTKNKKRKSISPLKHASKKKESLPIKIEKQKIEKLVLKTKICKNKDKVESPKETKANTEDDSIFKSDNAKLQEQINVPVNVFVADVIQPVLAEVSEKCDETQDGLEKKTEEVTEDTDKQISVNDEELPQSSVQEHSITSSTSAQESEVPQKPMECKLAQQISEEWEEDCDEMKALPPPASTKKRLSLEEYNSRKRCTLEEMASQQSDITNNLLDNIKYSTVSHKRELSPDSPILSVNFSNKTYSRAFGSSSKTTNHYDSLTNSIELQLPKLNRIPQKPIYSQEYLQNALRNDLYTVNAFTTSLIKENQQLMQRFLNQQRLTLDELKKVKQIIRYKRLIQQLTTLKITGLNSSTKYDNYSIRRNMIKPSYEVNSYDLDNRQSNATKVTMEDPLKSFSYGPERRKRKRFRFLYSDRECVLNSCRNPRTEVEEPCNIARDLQQVCEPNEESGDYSVYQGASDSQLTLVFKRSFKNDPKMQPFVKLERLFSIDQLAKNRFY